MYLRCGYCDVLLLLLQDGVDSRGLPTFRVIDGTNHAESCFGEVEKPFYANGGYSKTKWQGKLLNKVGRMNERERVTQNSGIGPGHYHLQRARLANELAEARGEPLPHPALPKLRPLANTLQGTDAFDAEVVRQSQAATTTAAAPQQSQAATTTIAAAAAAVAAAVATSTAAPTAPLDATTPSDPTAPVPMVVDPMPNPMPAVTTNRSLNPCLPDCFAQCVD